MRPMAPGEVGEVEVKLAMAHPHPLPLSRRESTRRHSPGGKWEEPKVKTMTNYDKKRHNAVSRPKLGLCDKSATDQIAANWRKEWEKRAFSAEFAAYLSVREQRWLPICTCQG